MTVTISCLFETAYIPTATTTVVTCPASAKISIDKCIVADSTGAAASFSMYVVPSGGSAGASNAVIPSRNVATQGTDLCAEMIGQILNPGDSIAVAATTANALTLRISGRTAT